jgi:hypothetical protein
MAKNKYTISLSVEMLEILRGIALELGYIWGNKGSITLLLIGICKGEVTLSKNQIKYEVTRSNKEE